MKINDYSKWDIWNPQKNALVSDCDTKSKISICTTCMGRTNDLRQTLLQNINDNISYGNVEFVVLNYGSKDDMHDYMMSNEIRKFIKSGIIRYLRTKSPNFFSMSHSRNIAFLNSTGDIVTNVDADNYTGFGFAEFINRLNESCIDKKPFFSKGKRGLHGRIGVRKSDFISLGGYDEDLSGYGWDDHSLLLRAMMSDYRLMWWHGNSSIDFTKRIKTPRNLVGQSMLNKNWKETEKKNQEITLQKINSGNLVVNRNKLWGTVDDLEIITS